MFIHEPLTKIVLDVGYNSSGRYYTTPEGNRYTSVTTCTSYYVRTKLDAWKKKVGIEEANRISKEAANTGTILHEMCEKYLNNTDPYNISNYTTKSLFNTAKPALNNISNIKLLEANLYSDKLQLAGSVDCVADYNGVLSIIDFKTSKAPKPLDWIENYFVQETIYAAMVYERYHITVPQIVTIITCRNLELQVIVKPINKALIELMYKYINYYRTEHHV